MLKTTITQYKTDFDEEWEFVYKTLSDNGYEQINPGITDPTKKSELYDSYVYAFNSVVTRCFGWGLPCTTMVPYADCINHANVDSSYEMISKFWRPRLPISFEYYGPDGQLIKRK